MNESVHIPQFGPATIAADDPRYESLLRGTNHRFVAKPDRVCVVTSTEQVVAVVGAAVGSGLRVTVRSGGHGFEGFFAAEGGVLLDMSEMTNVYYDPSRTAFAVEPGALLGHVYRVLFKGWNVTIPGGECTEVGVGGHFVGGGYGPLSRRLGAVVDYLYAVEVVVVDADGAAHAVVATCEPDDPHRDLWWAHTGGGGGNFGVVTRYWVRSPGVTSTDPAELLPKAPSRWRIGFCMWPWESMTEESFTTLLRNVGTWFEQNSAPGSPHARHSASFYSSHRSGGALMLQAMIDDEIPDAAALLDTYFDTVSEGVGVEPTRSQVVRPWLYFAAYPNWGDPGTQDIRRIKIKAAYLRKGYTERQLASIWQHLTGEEGVQNQLILIGYGGQVNTVAPDATATAQRDSVLKAAYMTVWGDEAEDHTHLTRLREFYRDVYADTGGVPVPNEVSDGSYINYPDVDLADPTWNTSGVPWSTLYYKDNYPRLQQVKRRYDPRNEFRHGLSVELP
ncbi:FAD-binding protein [Streptosporangium sp. NBC_01756]|uniref:FAD-binding protein n=1 Tax=Streptosporangium sp. NBC_01756 TaxID=2975950 RepID=UPI002DD99795|nr:FAD-binding protein [Streptosporangium sp. NBC_01756]WSC85367.1 FAD-binding protein [Streptosporangium sp. NBC_01756]